MEYIEVPEGAVIIIRGKQLHDEEPFIKEMHERYPKSLLVFLSEDVGFEVMSNDNLQAMLEDLLEHRRRTEEGAATS